MGLVRCAGFWTLALAVVHVATTGVSYDDFIRSILQAGVVGAARVALAADSNTLMPLDQAEQLASLITAHVRAAEDLGSPRPEQEG